MPYSLVIERLCACAAVSDADLRHWATTALQQAGHASESELGVRLVDLAEMSQLNGQYRNRSGPTNVLSFPAELPEFVAVPLLGDLVICVPVVAAEAAEQGKTLMAHWAHLVVHGCLHLLGFDHQKSDQAAEMEGLEVDILATLGFANPYEIR